MNNNMNYNTRADTTPVQYRDKPKFRKEYVDQLKAENDQLRAENERLREVITKISGIKIHLSGQERYIQLQGIISMCEEALNEVKE